MGMQGSRFTISLFQKSFSLSIFVGLVLLNLSQPVATTFCGWSGTGGPETLFGISKRLTELVVSSQVKRKRKKTITMDCSS
jgi:hypothetical protein